MDFSYPERNFEGNQLPDCSMGLSPLYQILASDLHVSTVQDHPPEFLLASVSSGIVHNLSGLSIWTSTQSLNVGVYKYIFTFVSHPHIVVLLAQIPNSSVRVSRRESSKLFSNLYSQNHLKEKIDPKKFDQFAVGWEWEYAPHNEMLWLITRSLLRTKSSSRGA